jgi:hypothetical protein
LDEAIEANVRHAMAELRAHLRARIQGGIFNMKTGEVTLLP